MLERQTDGIESAIETVFSERVDLESVGCSVRSCDPLVAEIHCQGIALCLESRIDEGQHFLRLQDDGQDTVLETVVVKNIGEAGGDHAPESLIE